MARRRGGGLDVVATALCLRRRITSIDGAAPSAVLRQDLSADAGGRARVLPVGGPRCVRPKIVGCEVHATDDVSHTAHLAKRRELAEGLYALQNKTVLPGANGATFEATTV